ncbi:MAG TPA: hypothetical protein IGS52_02415 [Oscillatoriaceae cyanobacterium M33_DOE_052]|uniref:Uncharacterized protein n=1 Tax=Planktothricoides sp. SpSt-374 TaxID=2282167 RepID=A0A7C3VKX3_9CYAN|nr:hypothetical protein [Oscillatoriaceae cyanobacterium M33_DOE_052]
MPNTATGDEENSPSGTAHPTPFPRNYPETFFTKISVQMQSHTPPHQGKQKAHPPTPTNTLLAVPSPNFQHHSED